MALGLGGHQADALAEPQGPMKRLQRELPGHRVVFRRV